MSEPTPPELPPGWSPQQPPPYGAVPPPPPPPPGTSPDPGAGGWGGNQGWGPATWAPVPEAPKPGVVPLRPLTVLEILDGAITTMRRYPKPMLGLSFIVAVALAVMAFLVSLLSLSSLNSIDNLDPNSADAGDFFAAMGPLFVGTFIRGVVQMVAIILLTGVLTVVVGQAVLGKEMSIGDAWRALRPRAWRLIGLSIVLVLGSSVGAMMCLVPGVIFIVFFALSGAALVLEKGKVFGSMGRSASLVNGSWWRTFGVLLLVVVIYEVISTAVTVPFAFVTLVFNPVDAAGNINSGWFVLSEGLGAIGSVVAGTIGYPFVAASIVLLYVDRRMRREGLDLQLAQAAQGS